MKKATIEKLFRRYIGIYDDVVFRTTGEHINENEINTVNDQVDQLFKEYEHVETLNDFNQFTKKIQKILTNTVESASKLNKEQQEKTLNETYWRFNNDPEGYIQKEIDETISKIIPDSNGNFYIPHNPYLDSIMDKGYEVKLFNLNKIQDHINKIAPSYKNNYEEYKNNYDKDILDVALANINDFPIQFCLETIKEYFYDKWYDNLLLCKNSDKNKIIIEAINSKLKPHTKEYEKELDLLFKTKDLLIDSRFNSDIKKDFLKNVSVRIGIIEPFLNIWKILIFENKNLSKHDKNNLLKKYNIIKINSDNLTDASIIRFNNFVNNFNGGGSINLTKEFTSSLSDNTFLPMIINMVDAELTILVNELETVKFDKDVKSFVLNNNYSNIINDYYKFVENDDSELSQDTQTGVGIALSENENKQFNKQLNKINILYSLVDNFNKQYKYKYIIENIKSKFKNIIKIK